jgi:hypothetical protein
VSFLYTTTGPAPIAIAGHIALVAGINPQLGSPNGVTLVHTANVGVTGGIMDQLSDTATIPDATISVNDTHLKFVYEGILDPGADPYTITFQSFRVVMRSAP